MDLPDPLHICGVCSKPDDTSDWIYCDNCYTWFHSSCLNLSKNDVDTLGSQPDLWFCLKCTKEPSSQRSQPVLVPCPYCPADSKGRFKPKGGLQIHITKIHPEYSSNSRPQISNVSQSFPPPNLTDTNILRDLESELSTLKSTTHTLRRIPKGLRKLIADKLGKVIKNVLELNTVDTWRELLTFSYKVLRIPDNVKKSLVSSIKLNIDQPARPPVKKKRKTPRLTLENRVEAKVADFDISGAIKLLSSEDSISPADSTTLHQLRIKHPSPSRSLDFPVPPTNNETTLSLTPEEIYKGISSFKSGSAPGIDGLRPQFLKDLTSISAGLQGKELLKVLTQFSNFLLQGKVPELICPLFYGASLCALKKKDGGLRPIAVGNSLRRLVAKVGCLKLRDDISPALQPHQLGFGTKQGCEAALHAVRSWLSARSNNNKVLLKIDFKNAFNSLERDSMLHQIKENTPHLFPFLHQCYRNPSLLFFGAHQISSQVGCQQGDPCGPMTFSLSIQPLVNKITSELNVWYLDDGTLGGPEDIVFKNFSDLITQSKALGLEVNPNKCELFFPSGTPDDNVIKKFETISPGIRIVKHDELTLLGSPIFETGFHYAADHKYQTLKKMLAKLANLNSHVAYFLLKNCFSIPKFTYLLRTTPTWKFPEFINNVDSELKHALENILNIQLNDQQWTQASLPINSGGLGIRKLRDISLPAFLSSSYGVITLVAPILNIPATQVIISHLNEALELWNNSNLATTTLPHVQKNWDAINTLNIISKDLSFDNPIDKARFNAVRRKESGAWLHSIPSKNIGSFMDNNTFRICIALRLGCKMCQPHNCRCGSRVSEDGLHGLNCVKCAGRFSRHSELNTIIQRALSSIGIPSTLEPTGMFRNDGKRPDGLTLIPWAKGQALVWDVTCVNTVADCYMDQTPLEAGAAAKKASVKKQSKYHEIIAANYLFIPFAVETLGPWCDEAIDLISFIGKSLNLISGDNRSKYFLIQRISLAIQRGNAASIMGTLPAGISMDEIFYL